MDASVIVESPAAVVNEGSFPEPRAFQKVAHEALRQGARDGHKNQILVAPTGAGKLFCGLRLIHESLRKGKRAVFVCERKTLIEQACATADRYGMGRFGVIQADHWRYAPSLPFQIASAQTLALRKWPENIDLAVIDECHVMMKTWVDYAMTSSARCIGLTATPMSKGLGKVFTNVINAVTMAELVESGVLVPMRIFSCTQTDMKGAAIVAGEWKDTAAAERGMAILGDVVIEWQKLAEGRKTIVFGSTIAHCEELCKQFNECGVMAAVFCATTTDAERERILDDYRRPDSNIRVLVSVDAISRGFDIPDVQCIVDCRPLRKSFSTFVQMIGRGLRSAPDKLDCMVLDHSGNVIRFAKDFEDLYFSGIDSLDMGEKLDKTVRPDNEKEEPKGCPKCGYKPFSKRCMACGHERPVVSTVEHEPGNGMTEIILARNGKTKLANDPRHLYAQIATYVRQHGNPETAKGRAAHLYRDIMGKWPPNHFNVHSAPEVPVSVGVMGQIRRKSIAFAKGMARKAMA